DGEQSGLIAESRPPEVRLRVGCSNHYSRNDCPRGVADGSLNRRALSIKSRTEKTHRHYTKNQQSEESTHHRPPPRKISVRILGERYARGPFPVNFPGCALSRWRCANRR